MRGSQKNINYKIKWTPEFAYAIGLLTTDGSLSKDGRHIEFTSKDLELVKTFKRCMNLTNTKIGTKTSGFTDKRYPRIQFSNIRLYRELLKIGLSPNKSKTLSTVSTPNKYFFDFLRGCFDGDGSSYGYWDPRWPNSFMFYITFYSGSLSHIKWLRTRLKSLLKINGHITSGKRVWQLKYAKQELKILIPKMYYNRKLPLLERKYKKIKDHLKKNDQAIKNRELNLDGRVMKLVDICA